MARSAPSRGAPAGGPATKATPSPRCSSSARAARPAPGRVPGRRPRVGPGVGVGVEVPAAPGAERLEPGQVVRVVDPRQLLDRGLASGQGSRSSSSPSACTPSMTARSRDGRSGWRGPPSCSVSAGRAGEDERRHAAPSCHRRLPAPSTGRPLERLPTRDLRWCRCRAVMQAWVVDTPRSRRRRAAGAGRTGPCPSPAPDRSGCVCVPAASAAPTSTWPRVTWPPAAPGDAGARDRRRGRPARRRSHTLAAGRPHRRAVAGPHLRVVPLLHLGPREPVHRPALHRAGTSTGATPSTPWSDEAYAYALRPILRRREVAPLLCAGIIGYRALQRANLPDGGRLGIYGFGGSAHLTAQIALARGARVHVMTRSAAAQELALELGAAERGGRRYGATRAARLRHPLRPGGHARAARAGRAGPGRARSPSPAST